LEASQATSDQISLAAQRHSKNTFFDHKMRFAMLAQITKRRLSQENVLVMQACRKAKCKSKECAIMRNYGTLDVAQPASFGAHNNVRENTVENVRRSKVVVSRPTLLAAK
jgi:hypothetical protein